MNDTITLRDVHQALLAIRQDMARREDVEALLDGPLLRANRDTRRQVIGSRRDKATGKTIPVTTATDLLA